MGFHLRGYTFLCDQGFGSYGQNKFWTNILSIDRYSVIGARACAGGPSRARTPPHMTSEVMLSAFIRVYPRVGAPRVLRACVTSCLIRACDVMPYPRACDVIIRVYPRLIVRVCYHTRLLTWSLVCVIKVCSNGGAT